MSTIVFFHAHPDDEASGTGATMRLAADAGHRIVCVFATHGEHGSVPTDLAEGESLSMRRRAEAEASAHILGIDRVTWLGYADSGMTGWAQNGHHESFHRADLDSAARRLAVILDEEDADVLVHYDWHGGYGHPDHVKVHQVARRALDSAARRPRELQGTMNRDHLRRLYLEAKEAGLTDDAWDPDSPADDGNPIGSPEADLHWHVDARGVLDIKRAALAAHASQEDVGWMLAMPDEQYALIFGDEWFIEEGREPGLVEGMPF